MIELKKPVKNDSQTFMSAVKIILMVYKIN